MTGQLTLNQKNVSVRSSFTDSTGVSSNAAGNGYYVTDSTGASHGGLIGYLYADGKQGIRIGCDSNYAYITHNGTTAFVALSSPPAWLSSLGLTPTSWGNQNGVRYAKQGSVVTVFYSQNLTVSLTANTWTTIATLPSGYRPSVTVCGVGVFGNSSQYSGGVRVYADGNVNVYCGTAINKLYTVFNLSYVI